MKLYKYKVKFFKFLAIFTIVNQNSLFGVDCSITGVSSINFGTLYPLTSSQITTSLTFSYSCKRDVLENVLTATTLCFNIGNSSVNSSINPRQMQNSSNVMNYQLYKNSTYSDIWGSQNQSGSTPVMVNLNSLSLTPTTGSLTIYAKINGVYNTLVPGNYQDSFTTATAFLTANTALLIPPGSCGSNVITTFPFTVLATVAKECRIDASSNINFGSVNLQSSNFVANNSISTTCSNSTPYTIGLLPSNNNTNGAGVMININNSTQTIPYQLSQTSNSTNIWGNASNNTVSKSGSGSIQSSSAYAIVPSVNNYVPGNYRDSVTITVTY